MEHAHLWIERGQPIGHFGGFIGAAVVDDDDLEVLDRDTQRAEEALYSGLQIALLVKGGDED